MRQLVVAVIGVVLGLVIGGLQPRAELRALRAERAEAARGSRVGEDLARLLTAGRPTPPAPPPSPRQEAVSEVRRLQDAHPAVAAELEALEAQEDALRAQGSADLAAAIEENADDLAMARAALELRRAQARAALAEQADPSAEQMDEIDAAWQEMNVALQALTGPLAEMALGQRDPDRREAMEFAADAIDAMLVAEDRVLQALDDEQRGRVSDEAVDPFAFVDPAIIDVLTRLGDAD